MSEKTGLTVVAESSEATAAVGKILSALEGMQEQMMSLTDLVVQQDKRIILLQKRLEKLEFGPSPVIDVRGRVKGKGA